ncbi:MAG: hypothetical protein RLZZ535_3138, partial [Cyanobacteriota bacterium]
ERAKTLLIDSDSNRTSIEWSRRGSLPFTVEDERKAIKLIPRAKKSGGDSLK